MKEFKGRPLFADDFTGEAIVSHNGFNTLASFQSSLLKKSAKEVMVSDQNNPDLFKKNITGKILCLPRQLVLLPVVLSSRPLPIVTLLRLLCSSLTKSILLPQVVLFFPMSGKKYLFFVSMGLEEISSMPLRRVTKSRLRKTVLSLLTNS